MGMKPVDKLLKLADEFEEMAESGIRPVYDAMYEARMAENNEFAEKNRKEAVATVSSMLPPGVDFDVMVVDKGPDSEGTCFTTLAVQIFFVGDTMKAATIEKSLLLEEFLKKIYASLAAGDYKTKLVEISNSVRKNHKLFDENQSPYNHVTLTVDIEK